MQRKQIINDWQNFRINLYIHDVLCHSDRIGKSKGRFQNDESMLCLQKYNIGQSRDMDGIDENGKIFMGLTAT
ncbi:hypothetical protein HZS_6879 [Henneguya salminicola]|nr:hypothetical protein HZS_6879 [Henneguya salminicola]